MNDVYVLAGFWTEIYKHYLCALNESSERAEQAANLALDALKNRMNKETTGDA